MPIARVALKSLPMQEALDFWQRKIPLEPADFYALAAKQRVQAFTVSGLAKLDQIMTVQKSITQALSEGLGFEEWKAGVADVFREAGWTGNSFFRLDNIFRTNIQTAYNAGRWDQAQEARRFRPFGMYSAILDDRVRPTHAKQNGKVYPLDHPYWEKWWPPNGYNCRCTVRTLTAQEVKERGLSISVEIPQTIAVGGTPIENAPDNGFGFNPGKTPFTVDLSGYPEPLRRQFLAQAAGQPLALMQKLLSKKDLADMKSLS